MKKLLLISLFAFIVTGCASVMTVEETAPKLNSPITEKLTIAIVDHML